MEVREATLADVPVIVDLLRMSLGESLMPKSERYWRWKHIENPFGASPVLLCYEGSLLVGVRAFMRWEWKSKGKTFRAVRAVDTATHPEYQGKGIFKKLTLSLVNYCKEEGCDFVFNTPNEQSRPGYLKMGWEVAGKLPIRTSINNPFRILKHIISNPSDITIDKKNDSVEKCLGTAGLDRLLAVDRAKSDFLTTNISIPYLKWRYADVPVAQYEAITTEANGETTGLLIGRLKQSRLGKELRITDYFVKEQSNIKDLARLLDERKKQWGVDYTTLSGGMRIYSNRILSGLNFKASVGPVVTIRSLALTDLGILKNFNNWSPSLGDLELF